MMALCQWCRKVPAARMLEGFLVKTWTYSIWTVCNWRTASRNEKPCCGTWRSSAILWTLLCRPGSFVSAIDKFLENCRFKENNDFRKSYQELFKRSMQLGRIDTSVYSTEDVFDVRVEQFRRLYKFYFNLFWQRLTESWYTAHCLESDRGRQCLIRSPIIFHCPVYIHQDYAPCFSRRSRKSSPSFRPPKSMWANGCRLRKCMWRSIPHQIRL